MFAQLKSIAQDELEVARHLFAAVSRALLPLSLPSDAGSWKRSVGLISVAIQHLLPASLRPQEFNASAVEKLDPFFSNFISLPANTNHSHVTPLRAEERQRAMKSIGNYVATYRDDVLAIHQTISKFPLKDDLREHELFTSYRDLARERLVPTELAAESLRAEYRSRSDAEIFAKRREASGKPSRALENTVSC
jgi:hypothetical protein